MSNVLENYMKSRFNSEIFDTSKKSRQTGPVVSISRDYGCRAKRLADLLSSALNKIETKNKSKHQWQWVGKEILDESARELNLDPNMIKQVANRNQSGLVKEIVSSLSKKYYPGDQKILNTIGQVIRNFGEHGHVIIVGRGGVSVTRDIPNSLHIKLQAPLEWRIDAVSKNQNISLSDAKVLIENHDNKRDAFRAFFEGKKINDNVFDIIFNYKTLKEEDIISTIIQLMESKNMV